MYGKYNSPNTSLMDSTFWIIALFLTQVGRYLTFVKQTIIYILEYIFLHFLFDLLPIKGNDGPESQRLCLETVIKRVEISSLFRLFNASHRLRLLSKRSTLIASTICHFYHPLCTECVRRFNPPVYPPSLWKSSLDLLVKRALYLSGVCYTRV